MLRYVALSSCVLVLGSVCGSAAEVKWTATGRVQFVHGADLLQVAAIDDPVSIELSYDNASEGHVFRQFFDLSDQLFWQQEEYYDAIDIDLRIRIGGNTWRGTLVSGSEGPPYSIEIQDVKVAGDTVDFFKVTVAGEDGGDFPSFPGGVTLGANPSLRVEFRDESTDGGDPPDYLDSTDLKCVSQSFTRITEARGSISSGTGQLINFTMDPATIRTQLAEVRAIELKKVTYDHEFEEVSLTWASTPGKFYVIQYLANDLCWREKSSTLADSTETTWAVLSFGDKGIYRVVEEE
ncbi:MAG: hypothetical protein HRU37_01270 [Roseibacillus sp.]|nr:hypothetical protein [Roseibacillus sp.]